MPLSSRLGIEASSQPLETSKKYQGQNFQKKASEWTDQKKKTQETENDKKYWHMKCSRSIYKTLVTKTKNKPHGSENLAE